MMNESDIPPPAEKTPWLVCCKPKNGIQTFCTTSPLPPNNKTYVKSIPQLCQNSIVGSSHNWLILQNHANKHKFSLYNPVNLQTIQHLPSLPSWAACSHPRVGGILTRPLDCNSNNARDCVLFVYCSTQAFVCSPVMSNPTWVFYSTVFWDETLSIYDMVVSNGIVYCWADVSDFTCTYFLQIEFADYGSSLKSLLLGPPNRGSVDGTLVESCGRIYSVSDPCSSLLVKVWEFDFQEMRWVEVKCLGGRAFFLGLVCNTSTWCWGTTNNPKLNQSIQENSLYFIGEEDVYSCRLDNGCMTSKSSCQNLEIAFGPRGDHDSFAWFMPQYQRFLAGKEKQIFKRVDEILHQLAIAIKPENQALSRQQNQAQEKKLWQLPDDLIELIAKKLPLFDYWSFRATSKMFQFAFHPTPVWRIPLFIYILKQDSELYQIKDPRQNGSCSSTFCVSNYYCRIIASSRNGWLLVKCINRSYIEFYNLFTKIRIEYSPNYWKMGVKCIKCVGFSTRPTSDDCQTVVYCSGAGPNTDSILYYSSVNINWKHYKLKASVSRYPCSAVYHKGAFYFMDKFGYLGAFRLVNGEARWRFYGKHVNLNEDCFWMHSSHLVVCDGHLLAVFIGNHRRTVGDTKVNFDHYNHVVEVFKCDGLEYKWVEVESLGNHSLAIGPSSFSFAAKEHDMGNRIYMPWIKDDGIVYYSLVTRKFYVVGSDIPLEYMGCVKKPWTYCWV